MSQPPYGPPPQGPPGSGPGQPPHGPPQGQPYYPPAQGQPPYPPPQGWGAPPPTPWYKKPWAIVLGVLLAIGLIGSAVNGGKNETESSTDAAPSSTSTVQSTSAAPPPTSQAVAPAPTTTPPPAAPAPPAGVNFTMPDFVGMDLQSAQNLVQANGVFVSRSHDLLGSRNQLVDSNWIVCDQNIPAGQQVTGDAEGLIDFGVVKREEACP